MNFRTQVPILKHNNPIDYTSTILSLGSCFAVNMADKLSYFKFQNSCNPFGILFHPLAIENLLSFAVSGKVFADADIFFRDERWHSFDVHSDLSNANKDELVANLNEIVLAARQQIATASHIIITYGTSWVYRNIEKDAIVANCHKVPQDQFTKELLSVDSIAKSMDNSIALLQAINPNVNLIFTISPVRHLKDGFVENQVSKSHLIAAVYAQLKANTHNTNATYFPSYEIMVDELREYRFYAEDMVHPSQVAIDYIWERFSETAISEKNHSVMEEVKSIQKGLAHRTFNPSSTSHKKFMENLSQKINELAIRFPNMQF